jgi:hypothetical protein
MGSFHGVGTKIEDCKFFFEENGLLITGERPSDHANVVKQKSRGNGIIRTAVFPGLLCDKDGITVIDDEG